MVHDKEECEEKHQESSIPIQSVNPQPYLPSDSSNSNPTNITMPPNSNILGNSGHLIGLPKPEPEIAIPTPSANNQGVKILSACLNPSFPESSSVPLPPLGNPKGLPLTTIETPQSEKEIPPPPLKISSSFPYHVNKTESPSALRESVFSQGTSQGLLRSSILLPNLDTLHPGVRSQSINQVQIRSVTTLPFASVTPPRKFIKSDGQGIPSTKSFSNPRLKQNNAPKARNIPLNLIRHLPVTTDTIIKHNSPSSELKQIFGSKTGHVKVCSSGPEATLRKNYGPVRIFFFSPEIGPRYDYLRPSYSDIYSPIVL